MAITSIHRQLPLFRCVFSACITCLVLCILCVVIAPEETITSFLVTQLKRCRYCQPAIQHCRDARHLIQHSQCVVLFYLLMLLWVLFPSKHWILRMEIDMLAFYCHETSPASVFNVFNVFNWMACENESWRENMANDDDNLLFNSISV